MHRLFRTCGAAAAASIGALGRVAQSADASSCNPITDVTQARDLGHDRGILVKCVPSAGRDCAAIENAAAAVGRASGVPVGCITPDTPAQLADYLTQRFAAWKPGTVVIMKEYFTTGAKWIFDDFDDRSSAQDAERTRRFLTQTLGNLDSTPCTVISAARPENDQSNISPHMLEVVASSFDELVLHARRPVLLEAYTPVCDACKGFAPRLRMIASLTARFFNSTRVAAMDILNNDKPRKYIPETATPIIRLFVPSPDGEVKSIVWAQDDAAFPSVVEAVDFLLRHIPEDVHAEHVPALREQAVAAENEARVLERLYKLSLEFMGLWNEYAQTPHARPGVVSKLRDEITKLYAFILDDAAQGSMDRALELAKRMYRTAEGAGITTPQLREAFASVKR